MTLLLFLGILGLIVLANSAAASPQPDLARLLKTSLGLIALSTLVMAGFLLLIPQLAIRAEVALPPGLTPELAEAFGWPLLLSSLWGLAVLFAAVRRLLARLMPLQPDSPVHTLALFLSGYLVANTVGTLNQGGLEALAESAEAVSVGAVLLNGVIWIAAALLGVGLWTRRTWPETKERVGLRPLQWGDVAAAGRWIILLFLALILTTTLVSVINPQQLELLESINMAYLGDLDTVLEWFVLGVASGIGEELLFRGAIQPVFGLVPTALLFAVLHVQYGFSPLMVFIFVLGLILGIIRQRYGTSTAILVHFGYNFIQGLLALLAQLLSQ
jgi:membrane protease YdiL (CAAX protease family)